MNPIENVWGRMYFILNRHYEQIWNKLMVDDEFRHNLIDSMVNRVKCLCAAKGSYTKY